LLDSLLQETVDRKLEQLEGANSCYGLC